MGGNGMCIERTPGTIELQLAVQCARAGSRCSVENKKEEKYKQFCAHKTHVLQTAGAASTHSQLCHTCTTLKGAAYADGAPTNGEVVKRVKQN